MKRYCLLVAIALLNTITTAAGLGVCKNIATQFILRPSLTLGLLRADEGPLK